MDVWLRALEASGVSSRFSRRSDLAFDYLAITASSPDQAIQQYGSFTERSRSRCLMIVLGKSWSKVSRCFQMFQAERAKLFLDTKS